MNRFTSSELSIGACLRQALTASSEIPEPPPPPPAFLPSPSSAPVTPCDVATRLAGGAPVAAAGDSFFAVRGGVRLELREEWVVRMVGKEGNEGQVSRFRRGNEVAGEEVMVHAVNDQQLQAETL